MTILQSKSNLFQRSRTIMVTRIQTNACARIIFLFLAIMLASVPLYASAVMEATFGSKGESGIWFDPSYDVMSPLSQTSTPGINFAGAGGVNGALAQVHEFDAAISTDGTGGAGYFVTESGFSSAVDVTVTPTYTDTSAAQTGRTYIIQHYSISNLTASTVNNIWMMSYINADLFRANSDVPAQRVGLLNDEKVTVSMLNGGMAHNLIFRQYQTDNTEIFYQGAMYKDGLLSAPDRYMVRGPGTPSGGGDAVYDEIYYNGIANFDDAQIFYIAGTSIEYTTEAEYASSIGFDIGSLSPGETAEIAVAVSTEEGIFAEEYFYEQYPLILIPEPSTLLLISLSFLCLFHKKRHTV